MTSDQDELTRELVAAVAANRRSGWERAADVLVGLAVVAMVGTASWATCRIEARSKSIEDRLAAATPTPVPCPCPTP